eukprot:GHVU01211718.1.p1 GENE.GHVU01211718.1~~GHVU01211718.1.p1  ORF type:complete len:180 (+),score=8.56 GHVU01211718.1:110-649(+)
MANLFSTHSVSLAVVIPSIHSSINQSININQSFPPSFPPFLLFLPSSSSSSASSSDSSSNNSPIHPFIHTRARRSGLTSCSRRRYRALRSQRAAMLANPPNIQPTPINQTPIIMTNQPTDTRLAARTHEPVHTLTRSHTHTHRPTRVEYPIRYICAYVFLLYLSIYLFNGLSMRAIRVL